MKHILLEIFISFCIICRVSSFDYCSINTKHVACGHSGKFASSCPTDARIERLSNENIQTILNVHNEIRNYVAGGNIPTLKSAAKMGVLKWDSELAYLAELNVKKCVMEHDISRATAKYPDAGQNLYWTQTTGNFGNINVDLRNAAISWFNEYKYTTQSNVNYCCGSSIGHFLQIVQDRAEAVGCAAARYTKNNTKSTLIACNYSFQNKISLTVYVSGAAASACPKGNNITYKNLCN